MKEEIKSKCVRIEKTTYSSGHTFQACLNVVKECPWQKGSEVCTFPTAMIISKDNPLN